MVRNKLGRARVIASTGDWLEATMLLREAHDEAVALEPVAKGNETLTKQARSIELFEVRTWLSMPATARPDAATIKGVLGDCRAEQAKPHNEELAAFCLIEEARLLNAAGDRDGAARLLAPLHLERRGRFRLTERWMLDLKEESELH
jgi:hypothetical protein